MSAIAGAIRAARASFDPTGVEERAPVVERELRAADGFLRPRGWGGDLLERADPRARLDAGHPAHDLDAARGDFGVGLREERDGPLERSPPVVETRHAQVEQVLRLLAAHAGGRAGGDLGARPRVSVLVERAKDVGERRLAPGRAESLLDRCPASVVPDPVERAVPRRAWRRSAAPRGRERGRCSRAVISS